MTPSSLLPHRPGLLLIRETAERIIRDFECFDINIIFSGNEEAAYNELVFQLEPVFAKLLNANRQKLMAILYKIDISEQKLAKTSAKYPSVSKAAVIAHLVIEREFQKVVTRQMHRDGKL